TGAASRGSAIPGCPKSATPPESRTTETGPPRQPGPETATSGCAEPANRRRAAPERVPAPAEDKSWDRKALVQHIQNPPAGAPVPELRHLCGPWRRVQLFEGCPQNRIRIDTHQPIGALLD